MHYIDIDIVTNVISTGLLSLIVTNKIILWCTLTADCTSQHCIINRIIIKVSGGRFDVEFWDNLFSHCEVTGQEISATSSHPVKFSGLNYIPILILTFLSCPDLRQGLQGSVLT